MCIGEVCLPGGHQDNSNEGPVETALREANEEIQLDPSLVEVIAVLPQYPTGETGLLAVTPVVCTLLGKPEDLSLVPNDEVEYAFWVPLYLFVENKSYTFVKSWWNNKLTIVNRFHFTVILTQTEHKVVFSTREEDKGIAIGYENHVIWGVTAAICITCSAIVLDKMPEFPCTVFIIQSIDESKQVVQLQQTALSAQQFEVRRGNEAGVRAKL